MEAKKMKILEALQMQPLSEEEKQLLKQDIAGFLRQMHDLDYKEIEEYSS